MHALSFKIKRVHHRILAHGRTLLRGLEPLTPARFDLLFALGGQGGTMRQTSLREELGIAPPTLTKMLHRLEQLEIIARKRLPYDRRSNQIQLTTLGKELLDAAIGHILRWDWFQLIFECFFGGETESNFFRVDELWSTMAGLALHLGDRALLSYPTDHPDD